MTKREQTTKEREVQEGTAKQQRARQTALAVFNNLMNVKRNLSQFNTKETRKIVEEVNARITWLIAENETYRDVAAEIWNGSQQGYNGCAVEANGRPLED